MQENAATSWACESADLRAGGGSTPSPGRWRVLPGDLGGAVRRHGGQKDGVASRTIENSNRMVAGLEAIAELRPAVDRRTRQARAGCPLDSWEPGGQVTGLSSPLELVAVAFVPADTGCRVWRFV